MKIALLRLSALGDIIQSCLALQLIKDNVKETEIHFFVDERFKNILENHPLIDRIYALPLKDKKILNSLKIAFQARKNKYDIVIDMQGLIKSAILSKILAKNNIGFSRHSTREGMASMFYKKGFEISYNENIYLRNLSLINFALNLNLDVKKELLNKKAAFISDKNLEEKLKNSLNFDEKKLKFLFHLGSSVENKIYPKERLLLLCKKLLSFYKNSKIFLCFGNENEKKMAEFISKNCKNENISLCPKLSLQELISITKLSDIIIGNDSGPTHLAFAMNKASLSIFGATPSKRNAFITKINDIIDAKKEIDARKLDKKDFCIKDIDENEIFEKIKKIVNEIC